VGFFSSARTPADEIRPITQERLIRLLDLQGWHHQIDDEGDLGGVWNGNSFYFLLIGQDHELLQVLGYLRPRVPAEDRDALRVFIEDWHRDHFWPKCYFVEDPDEGSLRLAASVTVDYEQGATDAQLMQHIMCGLGTAGQVFDAACETLGLENPDPDPDA
jgi:hypothetical protein